MPRTEDQRMVTGHGRYIDDLNKPGMVHAAFVRSTVARGRIIGPGRRARPGRMPGVIAVLTAAETNPQSTRWPARPPTIRPRQLLADRDVRYVGDPIAIVVAESRYLAEDAAELVSVDIEPDDPVVTAEQALAEGSPLVHPALPRQPVRRAARPGTCPSWTSCWKTRRTCSTRRSLSTGT